MKNTWFALLVAAALAGCASKPTLYYTLATGADQGTALRAAGEAPLFIELAPVAVPERLARPQMVVQQQASAQGPLVEVLEQHRWSASFENELRDALASGIAARLGAIDLTRGGRQPTQPAWRIAVQVQRFEAVEGARVDAAFSWAVRRADQTRSAACQWSSTEPVATGIDALAHGAQQVTARLAEAIARHVVAEPDARCPV